MDRDGEVIYQLRLPGGKHYVGRTTRPHVRLSEHRLQPGPWVARHGAPEALFVVERVEQRARGGAQEEAVVAHLMWVCGANAVRGGSRLTPQDYTRSDAAELARFIGTQLGLDLDIVSARLRDELPFHAACLDCRGATLRGRPRCLPCFTAAATCHACGVKGHLQRDCFAQPSNAWDAESGSQTEHMAAAACLSCNSASELESGAALCRDCFLASTACFDCGLHGHQAGDGECPTAARAAAAPAEEVPVQAEVTSPGGSRLGPGPRRRYRELSPRFAHLGVGFCWTCGRRGHNASDCNEHADVNGRVIEPWEEEA